MLLRQFLLLSTLTALLTGSASIARADDEQEGVQPSFSRLINIDALIDNHARFLARKYDLSDEQDEFTQQYLKLKADEFLEQHRELAYELIDELFAVRSGADVSTEQLVDWGRRALPLYEEAKTLIVAGNDEWRDILTPEQRVIHDEDLRLMYQSFEMTEDQLSRIIAGEMTIEEFRRGPQAPPARANPPRLEPAPAPVSRPEPPSASSTKRLPNEPRKRSDPKVTRVNPRERPGPAGSGMLEPPGRGNRGRGRAAQKAASESQWETYVREFVSKYQLDDGQTQRAQAILKDCQERADRITTKRKPEMEQLDKKLLELGSSKDKNKLAELAKIRERKTKLMEPIDQIFERQLKPRLEKLPTRAQRKEAEKAPERGSRGSKAAPHNARPARTPLPVPPSEPEEEEAEPQEDETAPEPIEPEPTEQPED